MRLREVLVVLLIAEACADAVACSEVAEDVKVYWDGMHMCAHLEQTSTQCLYRENDGADGACSKAAVEAAALLSEFYLQTLDTACKKTGLKHCEARVSAINSTTAVLRDDVAAASEEFCGAIGQATNCHIKLLDAHTTCGTMSKLVSTLNDACGLSPPGTGGQAPSEL